MALIKLVTDFVLYFVLPLCALAYWWIQKRFSFWKDCNVPYPEPTWINLAGNMRGVGTTVSFDERLNEIYLTYKSQTPAVGIYISLGPTLLITDPELAKTILVKEFSKFHDHGMYYNERDDPLSAHLFNIEGAKWKFFRSKLSPTFTSGKMKMMFSSIEQVGDRFVSYLDETEKANKVFDAKDLSQRFTTDVVGSTAFGLEINCLKGENEIFKIVKITNEAFTVNNLGMIFKMTFKNLARMLRMPMLPKQVSEYFMNLLSQTVTYREKNNIERNDFLQLLLQLKNKGFLDGETGEAEVQKLTFNEIAAQAFIFFFAGFDTSATAMNFSMYQLARHPEIQEKARAEVLEKIAKHDGKFSYEALMEMEYLNQVFNEAMRIHAPVFLLMRQANEDYNIPNSKMLVKKGTQVFICSHLFHKDPQYFPDPEKFDPERFNKENDTSRQPFTFLPFGEGPRMCIGNRFAQLQSRFALALLLKNFKITLNDRTKTPLEFDKKFPGWMVTDGVWLNVTRI